jgi:hypothetical protein
MKVSLYEDSDYADQLREGGWRENPLFYYGAHLRGKYNRYEPGYSSRPGRPRVPEPGTQQVDEAWLLEPVGGTEEDWHNQPAGGQYPGETP